MEPPDTKKRRVDEPMSSAASAASASSTASNEVEDVSMTPQSSSEPHQSENLNGVTTLGQNDGRMDIRLQQLLLSSPAHLFSIGTTSTSSTPQPDESTSWEQWLCFLAANLSPSQWQGYWRAHCAVFGDQAVPVHLLSFFSSNQGSPSGENRNGYLTIVPHPNDTINARYDLALLMGSPLTAST